MNQNLIISILLFAVLSIPYAQECGPSCPVCSGTGEGGGSLLKTRTLLISGIYLPTGEEEKGVISLRYGVFKWMDVGAGYTVKTEKPIWSLRLLPLSENEEGLRPGIIMGTGSVQTAGSDQSVFAQLTKSWEFREGFAMRVTGGIASLVPDFEKIYGIAGLTLTLTERFSPFASFDGNNFHFGISWIPLDMLTIAVLLVEAKEPAVSLGYRVSFGKSENGE
jgi:hypothetical protein